MQAKASFTGVLGEIAKKATAFSAAHTPEDDLCGKLKAAISSIDAFGAEGSQQVSADEVCVFSQKVTECCQLQHSDMWKSLGPFIGKVHATFSLLVLLAAGQSCR